MPASHKEGAGMFADPLQDHTLGEEATPPHQPARAGCPEWHFGATSVGPPTTPAVACFFCKHGSAAPLGLFCSINSHVLGPCI